MGIADTIKLLAEQAAPASAQRAHIELLREQAQILTDGKAAAESKAEALQGQVEQLTRELSTLRRGDTMEFRDNHYYLGNQGPFCPGCWDGKGQKVRLVQMSVAFRQFGNWECPVCRHSYP